VVIQRIDKTSGLLPASGQDANTMDEVFLLDTAPTEQAPVAGVETSAAIVLQLSLIGRALFASLPLVANGRAQLVRRNGIPNRC
jgi:hypothetical protein